VTVSDDLRYLGAHVIEGRTDAFDFVGCDTGLPGEDHHMSD
jgi:hypothetical protein